MTEQLSMFDIFEPPPAPVARPAYVEPIRRTFIGRAYGGAYEFKLNEDWPDPFEVEVRGIPCTIYPGFSTYVVDGPGSLFWSETGYRSFGCGIDAHASDIVAAIEGYIDGPVKNGQGCGGKLIRWWPSYVSQWQSDTSWALTYDRAEMWTQWGPEKHAEIWANHDARRAEALARMWIEGIDPNDVGKPFHHKGKWPRFERPAELREAQA